ncbi:MAG: serine/threonine-protein kinase [Gemmataceae bacterium]
MNSLDIAWLLARMEEGRPLGRATDAAWLCASRPELQPTVENALLRLAQLLPAFATGETLIGLPQPAEVSQQAATLMGTPARAAGHIPAPTNYEILDELGRGGMGVVYKARQLSLDRVVALKMILAGSHAHPQEVARFFHEAEAIAAIGHPGIVQVFEFGTYDNLPFLVMEYCPQGTLAGRLVRTPLHPTEAAQVVAGIARAVQAAHEKGIIHRDLKPSNILLTEDGSPRITDFGLARRLEDESHLTRTGALVGTPSYMAPEQVQSSRLSGKPADVYALGAILYECLTGRPPFRGATAMETMQLVLTQEPVAVHQLQPRTPRDLETICHKALAKEPLRRYASAAEMADDLTRFLAGEPVHARPIGPIVRTWKWVRRRPGTSALLASVVLSLLGGLAASSAFAYLSRQHEILARQREVEVREALEAAGHTAVMLVSNVLEPLAPPVLNREGFRNRGLSTAELNAVEDLATLPAAIDRVSLLEHILEQPHLARKFSWRLQPVLRALVELDLDRRQQTLLLVQPYILDTSAAPVVRLVSSRIHARLCGTDESVTKAAVGYLMDLMGDNLAPGEQIAALEDIYILGPHLSAETAAWLLQRLIEVQPRVPPPALELLASICLQLGRQVSPALRRDTALARALVQRLEGDRIQDPQGFQTWHALRGYAVLVDALDPAMLRDDLVRLLRFARMSRVAPITEAVADIVERLPGKVDADLLAEAYTQLAQGILEFIPVTEDAWVLRGLQQTLPRMLHARARADQLRGPLEQAITRAPDLPRLVALGQAFPGFVNRLPSTEASRLAALYIDRLLNLFTITRDLADRRALFDALSVASPLLDANAARKRLPVAARLYRPGEVAGNPGLNLALTATLLQQLPSTERAGEVQELLIRCETQLQGTPSVLGLNRIARALRAITPLARPRSLALAETTAKQIGGRCATITTTQEIMLLADCLAVLGPILPEPMIRQRVDELTDAVVRLIPPTAPLDDLRILRNSLRSIRPWSDPNRIRAICIRLAPEMIRQVAQDKWMIDVRELLDGVMTPLPLPELIALLRMPACIGPCEEAALAVLGSKLGRPFNDVWELMTWLPANRPFIDRDASLPNAPQ